METKDIVKTFLDIPYADVTRFNWGTAPDRETQAKWNVDEDTYINGVVLTVDGDYWMGYLLEVVERESSRVTFLVVNTFHGHRPDGSIDHSFFAYPLNCGTFFDRTPVAKYEHVGAWAVGTIYRLADEYFKPGAKR